MFGGTRTCQASPCASTRIKNVETSPAWPWLFDLLDEDDVHFVLAHAKRLRVLAESNYKRDEIDAGLGTLGFSSHCGSPWRCWMAPN